MTDPKKPHGACKFLEAVYGNILNHKSTDPELAATSIENWDELLEVPSQGLVAIRGTSIRPLILCAKELPLLSCRHLHNLVLEYF